MLAQNEHLAKQKHEEPQSEAPKKEEEHQE